MPADVMRVSNFRRKIREIERLGDTDFLRLEFDLVSHYRRHVDDQEWIAVELTRKICQRMTKRFASASAKSWPCSTTCMTR
jgi:hypothetical protein